MPMLVDSISIDFDKLLENGRLASIATLSKLRRVMVMTVDLSLMLIVAVLGPEYSWTNGAGEVFDMVFPLEGGNV
jgi:hypothetical protein